MTLDKQIEWAKRQCKYSTMLGDGDSDYWLQIIISLERLKKLENELSNNNRRGEIESVH